MPDKVVNLRCISYSSVIFLQWDPLAPNTSYCIRVNTRGGGELVNETCGVTDVQYSWYRDGNAPTSVNLTTEYVFTVLGINSLGRGPPSHMLQTNFSGKKTSN